MIESDWLEEPQSPARNVGGRPAKGHHGRQRKISCETCGFIAYASAGALERCGFPTCACGEPLELANLRDRLKLGDAQALAMVDAEAGAELERSARREELAAMSGFATRAANCGVCGRFKSRPADECPYCGDVPTQHGSDRMDIHSYNRAYGYSA